MTESLYDAAETHGEHKIVAFIYNRHCSRFNKNETSLDDALEIADSYHSGCDEILSDFQTVESYGDLEQYMR